MMASSATSRRAVRSARKSGRQKRIMPYVPIFSSTPAEHHGAGRGRLDVRVRQPGVQRKYRHFDREGDEEGQEQEHLRTRRKRKKARGQHVLNRRQIQTCWSRCTAR